MLNSEVIRAWKDARYRSTLNPDDLAKLPSHPSGSVWLPKKGLSALSGPGPIQPPYCSILCMTYEPCAESTITTTTIVN